MRFCGNAFRSLIILMCLSIFASTSSAEMGPEVVGKFKRSDGMTVTVMEDGSGGSVGFTGYTCWFEMSDGTRFSLPAGRKFETIGNCVVRSSNSFANIYIFPAATPLFPIAKSVWQFDGFDFVDVTTPRRRWLSPLVHTAHYAMGYVISLALFVPFLYLGARLIKGFPGKGWRLVLQAAWIVIGVCAALLYAFLLARVTPYTPAVFFILLAVGIALYRRVPRFLRDSQMNPTRT